MINLKITIKKEISLLMSIILKQTAAADDSLMRFFTFTLHFNRFKNMKKLILLLSILLTSMGISAQNLKPYVVGFETNESSETVKAKLEASLQKHGFQLLGQYQPANDPNRWLMVISTDDLVAAVQKVGGLTGFAATLRIAITVESGKTIVSYTLPAYWGNAYFRDDFDKVSDAYGKFVLRLMDVMKECGTFAGTAFGSKEGLSAAELREYHYMIGMPYFDDTVELAEFSSYTEAVAKIEGSVSRGVPNLKKVYKIEIPGKNLCLYGFALSGPNGESQFLPVIDGASPKHTAFLPYEVLVNGKEVVILHGRYRIALSFPDLTMGTFTKIMSTPGDIEDLLKKLVN